MVLRSPIICLLAHVDHGKTTLLDSIRGTAIARKEAGGITQMIGASYIPSDVLKSIAGPILERMKFNIQIPGLLFIDTPGHEAFTTLRARGGSIADLVILLVDIKQGFQPQTIESIKILKSHKTPFVIAANKIDLLDGWKSQKTHSFFESYAKQPEHVRNLLDEKIYEIMGKISEYGFDSERFDRISDFTKQIAIIPISAKSKEGLAELLVLIGGLSQKFLGDRLEITSENPKGSVLEVKEEKGLGTTMDVILYEGVLKKGQEIAYMDFEGVKTTKIRSLLEPDLKGKLKSVSSVHAAAGVKISAPNLEGAIPGSPFVSVSNKEDLEKEFKKYIFHSEKEGVVIRADSLGSVEAIIRLFKDANIPIKDAFVGVVGKKEVMVASAQENMFFRTVFSFNAKVLSEAREEAEKQGVKIIYSNIVYKLVEEYQEWVSSEKEKLKQEALERLPPPAKVKVLPGFVFRMSKPAIFGVEVLKGRLRKGVKIMNSSGQVVGEVKEIQKDKERISEASAGDQLAISCDGVVIGRDLKEGEEFYSYINRFEVSEWEKRLEALGEDEREVLEEIKKFVVRSLI